MRVVARLYDAVIVALAAVAGAILVASFALIIYDVVLRNMLISPPAFSVPSIEYGLLYITMLAGPWLVRTRGHVVVEILRQSLPPGYKRMLEKFVYVLCIVVCAVLAWASVDLTIDAYLTGEDDPRAINIPHTLRYGPMVISFVLMGTEFCRYLFGTESFYRETITDREGV